LNRQRVLKWRDLIPNTTSNQRPRSQSVNYSLAEMTDPKRDLVNLRAVPP
jgi:hypothetical protein